MNSPSLCVGAIIARRTAVAMKPHGGKKQALIRPFRPVFSGSKVIHCREQAVNAVEHLIDRVTKRSQIWMLAPNDLLETDRGQPSQLSQEHGS